MTAMNHKPATPHGNGVAAAGMAGERATALLPDTALLTSGMEPAILVIGAGMVNHCRRSMGSTKAATSANNRNARL